MASWSRSYRRWNYQTISVWFMMEMMLEMYQKWDSLACLHETFCGLKSYDPTLNSFVIPVSFQMFADCHCFLYQIIQILWQIWSQTHCFHYPKDFVPRHKSHLCNSMGITKNDTFKMKDIALSSSIQPLNAW